MIDVNDINIDIENLKFRLLLLEILHSYIVEHTGIFPKFDHYWCLCTGCTIRVFLLVMQCHRSSRRGGVPANVAVAGGPGP